MRVSVCRRVVKLHSRSSFMSLSPLPPSSLTHLVRHFHFWALLYSLQGVCGVSHQFWFRKAVIPLSSSALWQWIHCKGASVNRVCDRWTAVGWMNMWNCGFPVPTTDHRTGPPAWQPGIANFALHSPNCCLPIRHSVHKLYVWDFLPPPPCSNWLLIYTINSCNLPCFACYSMAPSDAYILYGDAPYQ